MVTFAIAVDHEVKARENEKQKEKNTIPSQRTEKL